MELTLIRDIRTDNSTTGKLLIDGNFYCFTLEDTDRGLKSEMSLAELQERKLYGKTCIPEGRYQVTHSFSGIFNKEMPLLVGVPDYDQVRIHPGNTEADTLGCILVGQSRATDLIQNSRLAFAPLWDKLQEAWNNNEQVFITIQRAD